MQDLQVLLKLLKEEGVYQFRYNNLEVTIPPSAPEALPEEPFVDDREEEHWRGLSPEEQRLLGVE